ncbi:MAG: NAD-dependent epimerase/dehydratase family protein [Myxococcales bacterium]|nr:NAD-dependent epimerase/dehydratase family protein [Myxococcales bacterium]
MMVTGASTPLGLAIIDALAARDALREVSFVLAVGRDRRPSHLVDDRRLRYVGADLTHARAAHDLIWGEGRQHAIDTVIHAAQHRSASDQGHGVHRQNVESTRALLVACDTHPTIRRFVLRSFAEVYATPHATTHLLSEDDPLEFSPATPQWIRDRVEADLTAGAHVVPALQVAVLRCAELLAPESGSQLWDYLGSRVCLRPLGFDPIINVLSLEDAATAFVLAATSSAVGAFNIPGADTLPLSRAIAESLRFDVAVPGPLMSPLYRLRRRFAGFEFRYDLNARRFHFGGVLDGVRAREQLGYAPKVHVTWPRPWWRVLLDRLATNR